jgi:hypothetical protein
LTPPYRSASLRDRKGHGLMLIRLTALSFIAAIGVLIADPPAGRTAPAGAAIEARDGLADVGAQRRRRAPPRIVIVPLNRYYRQCVDWYLLEHRPSGDVVTPQIRCRWVAR